MSNEWRPLRAILLAFLALGSTGCGDERPPAGPTGHTSDAATRPPTGGPGTSGDTDASIVDAAPDEAGLADASLPPGCRVVSDEDPTTFASIAVGETMVPFVARRAFAAWDSLRCETPTLIVGVTDGACSTLEGERLVLELPRDQIGTGIFVGQNMLIGAPDDVFRVSYRPRIGSVLYQNCQNAAGTVTFEELGGLEGDVIRAAFSISLPNCSNQAEPPAVINAGIEVTVPTEFDDVCG